jgi:hypothetical protein
MMQRGGEETRFWEPFWSKFHKKYHRQFMNKSIAKQIENEAKRLPKWNKNRYKNSSEINTKTGIEKDHDNHEFSSFPEKVKP